MTQKTPLFKGHFYDLEAAWPQVEFKSFEITVKAPKDAPLKAGQAFSLTISPDALHLFHKGRRL
jgi:hypothetical protein